MTKIGFRNVNTNIMNNYNLNFGTKTVNNNPSLN